MLRILIEVEEKNLGVYERFEETAESEADYPALARRAEEAYLRARAAAGATKPDESEPYPGA